MFNPALDDAHIIKAICDSHQLLIAAAESVTVGHLQSLLGAVPGASTCFRGGATTYSIHEKTKLLAVDPVHAAATNCVSEQVTSEMAKGISRLFGVQIGIATTGYAEPMPGRPAIAPHAYYAIWNGTVLESGLIHGVSSERIANQFLYAKSALHHLRIYLESHYA